MHVISVNQPQELEITERQDPSPGPGEVLVQVNRAGICGSDLHILHGQNPFATYPRVVGHEFMGIIAAHGAGIEQPPIGTRVVIDPVVSCGYCHACRIDRPNVCRNLQVIGVHRDGGMANYAVLPAENAYPVQDSISDALAAMAEPFSCAANVLGRTGVVEGEWALIYGAGTMGLTAVQVAKMQGANVVVAEPSESRRQRAEKAGASLTLNPLDDNLGSALRDMTDGEGPSLVVDCAGVPQLLPEAIDLAATAGRIGLMSFSPEPVPIRQQDLVKKELSLFASRLNRQLIPKVLGWFAQGRIDGASLISHEFQYADAQNAFAIADKGLEDAVKVHLLFN